MQSTLKSWQLDQLTELAQARPDQIDLALKALWEASPDLHEEVVLRATAYEQISLEEGAEELRISPENMTERLLMFRSTLKHVVKAIVVDAEFKNVARLAESGIAVWEVVREFRRLGSVDPLAEAYPRLSRLDLLAALQYAEQNPDDVERQINEYESFVQLKRAYPVSG
jgi:uncharacterized protein (DUF433 family)